eukprot:COSAG01_NODE_6318_length_3739_cov_2.484341_1_plen_510_part_10
MDRLYGPLKSAQYSKCDEIEKRRQKAGAPCTLTRCDLGEILNGKPGSENRPMADTLNTKNIGHAWKECGHCVALHLLAEPGVRFEFEDGTVVEDGGVCTRANEQEPILRHEARDDGKGTKEQNQVALLKAQQKSDCAALVVAGYDPSAVEDIAEVKKSNMRPASVIDACDEYALIERFITMMPHTAGARHLAIGSKAINSKITLLAQLEIIVRDAQRKKETAQKNIKAATTKRSKVTALRASKTPDKYTLTDWRLLVGYKFSHVPDGITVERPQGGVTKAPLDELKSLHEKLCGYDSGEDDEDAGDTDPLLCEGHRLSDADKLLQRVLAATGEQSVLDPDGNPRPELSNLAALQSPSADSATVASPSAVSPVASPASNDWVRHGPETVVGGIKGHIMLNTVTAETKFAPVQSATSNDTDDGFQEEAPARQTRSANACVSVPTPASMPVPNARPRRKRTATTTNAAEKRPRGATQTTSTQRPKRKRNPNWLQEQRDDFEDGQARSEYSRK